MKKPLISVIVPVYNVEKYLETSIKSIVDQSIGFEKNIELILVNDGSSDDSSEICESYKKHYPNNIVYINQKNQGVSAARNNGLAKARGKYVNFFDSDDIWSRDALELAVEFLERNNSVDFVAFKIKFFDKTIDEHPSNYKFKKTRVIDINKEPDSPIFHLPTCVFRLNSIKNQEFDTRLKITEDAKFLSDVLVKKKAYGVLSKGAYNYRKRNDESSAIGGQLKNRDYYLTVPKLAYKHMHKTWKDRKGKAHKYIQYSLLSDISWRLNQASQSVLTESEVADYKTTIKKLIASFDDEVILKKRAFDQEKKIFCLKVKYSKEEFNKKVKTKNGRCYFNEKLVVSPGSDSKLHIDFIKPLNNQRFIVEGYISKDNVNNVSKYALMTSKGTFKLKSVVREQREISFLGDTITLGGAFKVEIEVGNKDTIGAVFASKNNLKSVPIETNHFSGFSGFGKSYQKVNSLLLRKESGKIRVFPSSSWRNTWFELVFMTRIAANVKVRSALLELRKLKTKNLTFLSTKAKLFELSKPVLVLGESILMIPVSITLRTLHNLMSLLKRNPIWLISDRGMAAGDNGEALFCYMHENNKTEDKNVYFVVSKKSSDYRRIKKMGRVLNQDSFRYKLLFLLADKIVSSQADTEVTNPFFRQIDHFVDLFTFDFVFLQHGVIRHDLSAWLNRFNKNIDLFVTSAPIEYKSILEHPYHYDKSVVKLTGLPRFDRLENEPKNKLILAPTYRKNLVRNRTNKNGARAYDPAFKASDYFEFYNSLINDIKIKNALSKHEMIGELYLHPALAAQVKDFEQNELFHIKDFPYDYKTAFTEGSLLVSDYSSVVFDFAYLKKPVIYAHYDSETFFDAQLYEKSEFYSDAKDGFGPIAYDYEALIKEIVKNLENGCKMQRKYKERVERFFFKVDKDNSKRVYDAIVSAKR